MMGKTAHSAWDADQAAYDVVCVEYSVACICDDRQSTREQGVVPLLQTAYILAKFT